MANDVVAAAHAHGANRGKQHNAQALLMVLVCRFLEIIFLADAVVHYGNYDTPFCIATHSLKY
ncbi:hypothetical protein FJ365_04775 [Candidatus Dependentiae bacterium]|nr:hypothetical protein [Candidatus Dependentiae bacterium]